MCGLAEARARTIKPNLEPRNEVDLTTHDALFVFLPKVLEAWNDFT